MTKQAKREYIEELRPRYLSGSKKAQSSLLDEMEKVTKFNRKYLIRVLNKAARRIYPKSIAVNAPKVGTPEIYHAAEISTFLRYLWHATNQACSKRLQSLIALWLPWYKEATGITLSLEHQVLLTRMTHTTIDRLLADERSRYRTGKGRCTTKPGTLSLRKSIPIATDQWQERRVGFLEVDTVAHCGTSTAGQYVFSLNVVDIASGWVEPRAVWGKGETSVLKAFESIERAVPFPLRGFDSDNGGEFINHHLTKYLHGRKRQVKQTRSREYKKNDNAHIEQKNWTHIRQVLGYQRFDNPAVVELMNDLYANEYSLLMNYFLPSVKLANKERIGSKIIKRHDAPMTPCRRLLASRFVPTETKERLRTQVQSLNPFLLADALRRKVRSILQQCTLTPAPTIPVVRTRPVSPIKTRAASQQQHSQNKHRRTTHRCLTPARNTKNNRERKLHGN